MYRIDKKDPATSNCQASNIKHQVYVADDFDYLYFQHIYYTHTGIINAFLLYITLAKKLKKLSKIS